MKYIAHTVQGIEDVAIKEIEELTKAKAKQVLPSRLLFECSEKSVNELIYITRSLTKVCLLLSKFRFKTSEDIETELKKIKFPIKGTFAAKCERKGNHLFDSHEIEVLIGNAVPKGFEVDLQNPNTIIYADIFDDNCFVGIELTRKELQKRDYRIKAHPQSVNPCVAYAMVRLSGWKKSETLLDPFCRDGVIAIEAALYACNVPRGFFSNEGKIESIDKKIKKDELKVNAYDAQMPNVRSAEINAKLAAINKQINFSRTELDWLETKFKKNSVDKIVTSLPSLRDEKDNEKQCKEFFYQAEYIMKKRGTIVIAVHKPEILMKFAEKFKKKDERQVVIGEYSYSILTLEMK